MKYKVKKIKEANHKLNQKNFVKNILMKKLNKIFRNIVKGVEMIL